MPIATNAPQQTAALFDHLVGYGEHTQRDREAKRLGGLEIDDQFEFGRLLDRQIGGLFAFKDTPDVVASLTLSLRYIRSVAHQTTSGGLVAIRTACGNGIM